LKIVACVEFLRGPQNAWPAGTRRVKEYISPTVIRQSRCPGSTGALGAAGACRFVDFSQNCELRFLFV